MLQQIAAAVKLARVDASERDIKSGTIRCPRCAGNLLYSIRSNPLAHPDAPTVWGRCETPGCLEWMM
jgi:hypothetical protein